MVTSAVKSVALPCEVIVIGSVVLPCSNQVSMVGVPTKKLVPIPVMVTPRVVFMGACAGVMASSDCPRSWVGSTSTKASTTNANKRELVTIIRCNLTTIPVISFSRNGSAIRGEK